MTHTGGHAPNWYPDPMGRHEYRSYDGTQRTEHVTSHGRQSVDQLHRRSERVCTMTDEG